MQHNAPWRQRIGECSKGTGIAIGEQQLGAFPRKDFRQATPINPGSAGDHNLLSCKPHGACPFLSAQDAPLRADRQASALAGIGQAVPASPPRDKAGGNV